MAVVTRLRPVDSHGRPIRPSSPGPRRSVVDVDVWADATMRRADRRVAVVPARGSHGHVLQPKGSSTVARTPATGTNPTDQEVSRPQTTT